MAATEQPAAAEKATPLTAREVARWILDSVGGGGWSNAAYARAERMIKRYDAERSVNQSAAVDAAIALLTKLAGSDSPLAGDARQWLKDLNQ